MRELLFYTVDSKYIKYLSKFDNHISYNKDDVGHSRPYLGIVLTINEYDQQDKKYKDQISAEYRYINSHKEEIYKRANKIYKYITNDKSNFLKTISCNFKLLGEKCRLYNKKM